MRLRNTILERHSKTQTDKIVRWIGHSKERFDELVRLFLTDEYRVTQRAAWPLSYAAQAQPQLVKKHLAKLVNNLFKPGLHDAVKRNIVRLLQDVPVPKGLQGKVMDICFRFVENPQEAVAIKAFSITVLANLAKTYPEILPELKTVIEAQLPYQTAAFKIRARRILQMQ